MQGWFCPNPTGVDTLEWRDAPNPEPGAGQVRVRVHAASLNFHSFDDPATTQRCGLPGSPARGLR